MTRRKRSTVEVLAAGARPVITSLRSVVWQLRHGQTTEPRGIRFIFYHRVADDRDDLAVTPSRFRWQMAVLADQGYQVVDVVTACELLASGECPDRVISLSFDDGYLDVAQNAMPVLAKYGFRATVFVVTGAADGRVSFRWYREQPPLLRWSDIVALDRDSPLRFEAHTVTHPNLLALSDDDARAEIADSKSALEGRLGRRVRAFCYPSGFFASRHPALVAAAGYDAAVSSEPGVNVPDTDRFALRRTQICSHDGSLDFRTKIAGAHDSPIFLRGIYRRVRGRAAVEGRA